LIDKLVVLTLVAGPGAGQGRASQTVGDRRSEMDGRKENAEEAPAAESQDTRTRNHETRQEP